MGVSQEIYNLSKKEYVSLYMEKTKYKRIFVMKSNTQKKFLPKKTREAINRLMKYNCEIKYLIK